MMIAVFHNTLWSNTITTIINKQVIVGPTYANQSHKTFLHLHHRISKNVLQMICFSALPNTITYKCFTLVLHSECWLLTSPRNNRLNFKINQKPSSVSIQIVSNKEKCFGNFSLSIQTKGKGSTQVEILDIRQWGKYKTIIKSFRDGET
jgi:hypothetical protein